MLMTSTQPFTIRCLCSTILDAEGVPDCMNYTFNWLRVQVLFWISILQELLLRSFHHVLISIRLCHGYASSRHLHHVLIHIIVGYQQASQYNVSEAGHPLYSICIITTLREKSTRCKLSPIKVNLIQFHGVGFMLPTVRFKPW